MSHKWTKPKIRELHAFYMANPLETYTTIGARYGIKRQAIACLFRQEGLPSRGTGNQAGKNLLHRRTMQQRGRMALTLRREGKTEEEIMEQLGFSSRQMFLDAMRTLDDVGVPWRKTSLVAMQIVEVKKHPVEGECRIEGCDRPAEKRGLCTRDHKRAQTRGLLDEVGAPFKDYNQRKKRGTA